MWLEIRIVMSRSISVPTHRWATKIGTPLFLANGSMRLTSVSRETWRWNFCYSFFSLCVRIWFRYLLTTLNNHAESSVIGREDFPRRRRPIELKAVRPPVIGFPKEITTTFSLRDAADSFSHVRSFEKCFSLINRRWVKSPASTGQHYLHHQSRVIPFGFCV